MSHSGITSSKGPPAWICNFQPIQIQGSPAWLWVTHLAILVPPRIDLYHWPGTPWMEINPFTHNDNYLILHFGNYPSSPSSWLTYVWRCSISTSVTNSRIGSIFPIFPEPSKSTLLPTVGTNVDALVAILLSLAHNTGILSISDVEFVSEIFTSSRTTIDGFPIEEL